MASTTPPTFDPAFVNYTLSLSNRAEQRLTTEAIASEAYHRAVNTEYCPMSHPSSLHQAYSPPAFQSPHSMEPPHPTLWTTPAFYPMQITSGRFSIGVPSSDCSVTMSSSSTATNTTMTTTTITQLAPSMHRSNDTTRLLQSSLDILNEEYFQLREELMECSSHILDREYAARLMQYSLDILNEEYFRRREELFQNALHILDEEYRRKRADLESQRRLQQEDQSTTTTATIPQTTTIEIQTFPYIDTQGQPTETLVDTKQEVDFLLERRICRPSKSNWASPLQMEYKPEDKWTRYYDYRQLNKLTKPVRIPPFIQEPALHGKPVFSKEEPERAFSPIPIYKKISSRLRYPEIQRHPNTEHNGSTTVITDLGHQPA